MRSWSVLVRGVVLPVGIVFAVSLSVLVVGDRLLAGAAEQAVATEAQRAAERVVSALRELDLGSGRDLSLGALRELVGSGGVAAVVLLDAGGQVVGSVPEGARQSETLTSWPEDITTAPRLTIGGTPVEARFTVVEAERGGVAGVWVAVDRRPFEVLVRHYRVGVAAAGLVGVLVCGLLAALVTGARSRALAELSSVVARVSQGELELRHPERGPAELRRLARRVNRLAERFETSQLELARSAAVLDGTVRGRTRYLEQTNRALIDLANRDPLTGLANRRRLELDLDRHIELARGSGIPLAVIMMDLDRFKRYNDTAGHLAGDDLLRTVASTLRARTRVTDLVVRWGGDEFCILIPHTTAERALAAARSLVEAVHEAVRTLPDACDGLGASAGVACFPDDADNGTGLVAAADAALYRVKQQGRGEALRVAAG